jgi:hypothetical protein
MNSLGSATIVVTASPPVSPRVVAAILMIQNHKVSSGILPHCNSSGGFQAQMVPGGFVGSCLISE